MILINTSCREACCKFAAAIRSENEVSGQFDEFLVLVKESHIQVLKDRVIDQGDGNYTEHEFSDKLIELDIFGDVWDMQVSF